MVFWACFWLVCPETSILSLLQTIGVSIVLWGGEKANLPNIKFIIGGAIGILLFGLLAPLGLAAMETYTPTDPTMVIVWPLVAVFFVISIGLSYIWEAMKD